MKKTFWDRNAGLYDRFMRKDTAAYEQMYALIRPVARHKTVLELATGTGLIARHIVSEADHIEATDASPEMIAQARAEGKPIIILSGRPYHLDPEINHGIDKLITSLGAAVISEDVISAKETKFSVGVLNQWTYHARLYAAAEYVGSQKDMNLVQLVSFGCGVDAITTDEVRSILESHNKIYTQIKIDEITNLGAVKIRLRSLFAALEG